MIVTLSPASAANLTTNTAVRLALGSDASAADDAALTAVIEQASATIATHLRRILGRETVRETVRPDPLQRRIQPIRLSRLPLVSITAVIEDGTTLVADVDYEVDPNSGQVFRLDGNGDWAIWTSRIVKIDYEAGWLLPGQTERNLPIDIEACAIDLCRHWLAARSRDPLLRSTSVLNGLVVESFAVGGAAGSEGGIPADVACRLAPHRVHGL